MSNFIYNSARQLFSMGSIDWAGSSVKNPAWVENTAYLAGQKVQVLGNVYMCIKSGTSTNSATFWTDLRDGPGGAAAIKGASIADSDINWKYLHNSFEKYSIHAALVNTNATGGGTVMQTYTGAGLGGGADSIAFVPGTSRNMMSEFGYGAALASSSLIRNALNEPITAELLPSWSIIAPLTGPGRSFVASSQACTASNITFAAVPDAGNWGDNIEGMVIYVKNESPGASTDGSDWPVLVWIDTLASAQAMNINPNGGDIVVQWNSSGIFRL